MSAMLDAADIARRLNVSLATAYREMRRMLHVVVGKRGLRVSEAAFEAYLTRNSSQPKGLVRGKTTLPKPLSAPIRPVAPRTRNGKVIVMNPEPSPSSSDVTSTAFGDALEIHHPAVHALLT